DGDFVRSRGGAGSRVRACSRRRASDSHTSWDSTFERDGSRKGLGRDGESGAALEAAAKAIEQPDRSGSQRAAKQMTAALVIFSALLALLVMFVTCIQVLYLESLRIRARELPSLQFFKETLEQKIGLSVDRGALTFSLVKHVLLGIFGCTATT